MRTISLIGGGDYAAPVGKSSFSGKTYKRVIISNSGLFIKNITPTLSARREDTGTFLYTDIKCVGSSFIYSATVNDNVFYSPVREVGAASNKYQGSFAINVVNFNDINLKAGQEIELSIEWTVYVDTQEACDIFVDASFLVSYEEEIINIAR